MKRFQALLALALSVPALAADDGPHAVFREDFSSLSRWTAAPALGVELGLASDVGEGGGRSLRLDFDFHGRGGWAAARRPLDLVLPENYEIRLRLRGAAPVNHLEVKLVDGSGENVWWSVHRDFELPGEWTTLRIKKRRIAFAWGPQGSGELRRLGAIELAITAGSGGHGKVWIDGLEIVALPPPPDELPPLRAFSSFEVPDGRAQEVLDGDLTTAWRVPESGGWLALDLGFERDLGGLTVRWAEAGAPRRFVVEASSDEEHWRELRRVERGGGRRSDLYLPETEARYLRILFPRGSVAAIAEVALRPAEEGATPNAFFVALARERRRGEFPRGFSGEQTYWTVVGADADVEESLVTEDGIVELGERAPSLEPFVWTGGRLLSWADVRIEQELVDGDLPIPTVTWSRDALELAVTPLVAGEAGTSSLLVRYRLTNRGGTRLAGRLFVALRPFQANPPSQFLNLAGGFAPLREVACGASRLVADARRLRVTPAPDGCGAAPFESGPLGTWLEQGEWPPESEAQDASGFATAALAWSFDLESGASRDVEIAVPYHEVEPPADFDAAFARERERWRARLDRVRLELPADAAWLPRLLRSSLAYVLIHRDGPALQPGSRAYARSWIRDGALTGEALLRLGELPVARDFYEWFAAFQYPDGQVPCCVDRRGADPVPEHDSHGELIHLAAEIARYANDPALAALYLPTVERAAAAIDRLRAAERTPEVAGGTTPELFGLLPASISHEGYSSKPRHSYWDDGFATLGLADASWLAAFADRPALAAGFAASRDALRGDLLASLSRVMAGHGIDYLPGCAELGDFDSTSTTALLAPGGLLPSLPRAAVEATFDRYWREFRARRDGRRDWDVYTPYELRHVGAFVRLGWRERALELLDYFRVGLRPAAWNGWAEVVGREPRAVRFLGDLPHGWVASDFLRSLLDLFAFEAPAADGEPASLVLAAGVPERWLEGEGIAIAGLETPWGTLSYRVARRDGALVAEVSELARWPPGGVQLALPGLTPGERVEIDGEPAIVRGDGRVQLARLPARVARRENG